MSRLSTINIAEAPEASAQLFANIKKAVGKVPNAYAAIGTHAPQVLANLLQTNALLKQGELSSLELEAINLAVSEASQCDYCLAAHSMTGKMAGYTSEQIHQIRNGGLEGNTKVDALIKFALTLVTTRGTLPESAVTSVKDAGYSDRQIVEAIQAISAILFTNMFNRVNDTVVDFPKAA
ncbi:carboxymuconolactone decarboxylase family protein [Dyella telluris]|uniref:Carboxymuconolactone decarboxylase family protein n=1 Tax=Dyella telluris TaxID=2763498 RepID=A0A7G8Q5H7_9GAMM|nr:carboxymuconolactone decarboxylase family protein [Dyella telluris]QNK02035.1 carboxymuconolactone decarboxylase family protein [Dyella telluris]